MGEGGTPGIAFAVTVESFGKADARGRRLVGFDGPETGGSPSLAPSAVRPTSPLAPDFLGDLRAAAPFLDGSGTGFGREELDDAVEREVEGSRLASRWAREEGPAEASASSEAHCLSQQSYSQLCACSHALTSVLYAPFSTRLQPRCTRFVSVLWDRRGLGLGCGRAKGRDADSLRLSRRAGEAGERSHARLKDKPCFDEKSRSRG
ncbi:hypothetical protein BJY59DRAFT_451413 [Rhodotorula toruloides]